MASGLKFKKERLDVIEENFFVTEMPCPNCGGETRLLKNRPEQFAPICIHKTKDKFNRDDWTGCGYDIQMEKERRRTLYSYEESIKRKAENLYKYRSEVFNKEILNKEFSDFKNRDAEAIRAKKESQRLINEILAGVPIHGIINGKVGSGKTHLAVGIAKEVMRLSQFEKTSLFISYPKLFEQMKFSHQDPELSKKIHHGILKDIESVTVVVIDDIGAELGKIGRDTRATDYNITLLQRLVDARENQVAIFTTNLTAHEIKRIYGDRIVSRMLVNHKREDGSYRIITFNDTTDGRLMY